MQEVWRDKDNLYLGDGETLGGVSHQDAANKILALVRNLGAPRDVIVHPQDAVQHLCRYLCLPRLP